MRRTPELSNLSLDFLNPESRRIGNLYKNFSARKHGRYLDRLLNLYVLWCGEFCITQAGTTAECAIAEAALRRKIIFLKRRLIRVPMNDLDPSKFLSNRRNEYSQNREFFPDLFADRGFLLEETAEALIPKLSQTGPSLVANWEGAFEANGQIPIWLKDADRDLIRRIGSIPADIVARGDTLTWPDLNRELDSRGIKDHRNIPRNWLQHVYLTDYMSSFGLRTITNVPGMVFNLGYAKKKHLGYDYPSIKGVFDFWGLFDAILDLRDECIVELRRSGGFLVFRLAFDKIGAGARNSTQVLQSFAGILPKIDKRRAVEILRKLTSSKSRQIQSGVVLLDDFFLEVGSLARLEIAARHGSEKAKGGFDDDQRQGHLFPSREVKMKKPIFIGHGRSAEWLLLKTLLQERLKLPVVEFNSRSTAGVPTASRLQDMLSAAGFAFLILTAEDERVDGARQARMNVVHELGLFQGKLGFEKAIILLEEGCEEFTNIVGLGQIRFPRGNILAASEEIRRVLEREGLLQP